jgi:TolB-like protein/Tfp pilus assembly protein PilF
VSFISELKRRNVIRMAGLYIVGAWLILQVSETLLPIFDTPNWVLKLLVYGLFIGFIPTMIMAWIFELTPAGLKRDEDVTPENSIAPQTARRMERLIIALFAFALIFFAFDKFILAPQREAKMLAVTTKVVAEKTAAEIHAVKNKINPRSIAVLPFANMSGDPENDYFSDGISEEILNVLAGTPELQVAARTSSFSFKGKNIEVPEIAKALKVRMVLEGSVRKQGNQVRITAQLIDASNGFHLWSQTFDRDLKDIFVIQDEIAKAIGDELKVKLTGVSKPGEPASGTKNLEAYDLYLRGMSLWHTRNEKALWDAITLFEQAASMDPSFAQAYAGQALAYAVVSDYSNRMSKEESHARGRDAAERALALNPNLPEPYAALSQIAVLELRRETAAALNYRAIALRPSFATAHQWRGTQLMVQGKLAEALTSLEQASALDPRSRVVAENQSIVLRALGRNAEAKSRCQQALAFAPDYSACLGDIAMAELSMGQFAEARATLKKQAEIENPGASTQGDELFNALRSKSSKRDFAQRLAALGFNSKFDPASENLFEDYDMPSVLILLGEKEITLDYLERFSEIKGNYVDWAIMMPAMDPIRCEPRFVALVKKLKTHDPHFAKVCGGKN